MKNKNEVEISEVKIVSGSGAVDTGGCGGLEQPKVEISEVKVVSGSGIIDSDGDSVENCK
jgi:hypothetical protein